MTQTELIEFWIFNRNSILLAAVIALVSGPLFALGHEATLWVMGKRKPKG